jgi:hypothetical protein
MVMQVGHSETKIYLLSLIYFQKLVLLDFSQSRVLKEGDQNSLKKKLKLICHALNITTTTSEPFHHLKTDTKIGASHVNIHFIIYLSKSHLMFAKNPTLTSPAPSLSPGRPLSTSLQYHLVLSLLESSKIADASF